MKYLAMKRNMTLLPIVLSRSMILNDTPRTRPILVSWTTTTFGFLSSTRVQVLLSINTYDRVWRCLRQWCFCCPTEEVTSSNFSNLGLDKVTLFGVTKLEKEGLDRGILIMCASRYFSRMRELLYTKWQRSNHAPDKYCFVCYFSIVFLLFLRWFSVHMRNAQLLPSSRPEFGSCTRYV